MSTPSKQGVALITGASTGIGATYAKRLAARGHDLLIVARDQARLETVATALRKQYGVAVEVLKADLTSKADLQKVEKRLRSDTNISVLVNNAGIAVEGTLLVDELVDAALAGLDMGETVTLPTLPDAGEWQAYNNLRLAMAPKLSLQHAAKRYGVKQVLAA